jgi:uncharacterized protein
MIDITTSLKEVRLVRLQSGDDILSGLRQYVEDQQIDSAIILNGFGSVTHYHFHVVADDKLPPAEAYPKGEEALDIVSMSGAVLNGRVHAHITFTDAEIALGGHLEEGCRVLTFAVVCLGVLEHDGDLSDWDQYTMRG